MDASVSAKSNASTFETDVRGIVTAKHVRTAVASDAVAGARPSLVVEPGNEQELAKVLKLANAAGLAVIPRGGGTKLEWGNRPARADVIVSTARLDRVIEHAWADLTVSVEAGCTIGKLQETLAKHGQRLALDALWPERATVGGVLSTNDSGALRLRFGSLRVLVVGVTLALGDGTVASGGGRVVKHVAGGGIGKGGEAGRDRICGREVRQFACANGGDNRNDCEVVASGRALEGCGTGDRDWVGAAGWRCAGDGIRVARVSCGVGRRRRIAGDCASRCGHECPRCVGEGGRRAAANERGEAAIRSARHLEPGTVCGWNLKFAKAAGVKEEKASHRVRRGKCTEDTE